jgi:imidazole glycerol-phosphate synthase subunit HisH
MIAIIEYGSGNVGAIANVYKQLKVPHVVTSDRKVIESAERIILPGVGAFDATMQYLTTSGMLHVLNEQVLVRHKKVLGICVGMQILGDSSDEGTSCGLGWIPGRVRRIDESLLKSKPKLPHMGWNAVECDVDHELFAGINSRHGFYFLHSYFFDVADPKDVIATVEYGARIPCAIARGNVYGAQFHPEKSHGNGVALFKNFSTI